MLKFLVPAAALGIASLTAAQTVATLPKTLPGTFSYDDLPFRAKDTNGIRVQFVYDGSMLNVQHPILIQRLRFRRGRSTYTWTGGQTNVTCTLSTSPVQWDALTTTFANHVGKDVQTIFSGTLLFNSSPWFVDIQLAKPFLYNPFAGDLCFDFVRAKGGAFVNAGPGGYVRGTAASPFKANRVIGSPSAPNGSLDGVALSMHGNANACEITYLPPPRGLYAGFSATPVKGRSPLKVQFFDLSYSTDTRGVLSWAWDFDGDKKVDSTLPSPVHTFTATNFDRYFDVTLTVTDAVHQASTVTRKRFVLVNPSTAKAENFGLGSFSKSAAVPIALPPHLIHWNYPGVRGFVFPVKVPFRVTGFECPNNYSTKQSDQTVTLYRLKARPPLNPATYTPSAAEIVFHGTGKAGTILRPDAPISFQIGDWFAVLGACHTGKQNVNYNSYGQGSYASSVLGVPITLDRLQSQSNHRKNKGLGPISYAPSSVGRVSVHVYGNTTALPQLSSVGRPILGSKPSLQLNGNLAGAQGSLLFLGAGRRLTTFRTPFGDLLIQLPMSVGIPISGAKGSVSLQIPNNNQLRGVALPWQGIVFDIVGNSYGMTNGTEWYIGTR